MKKNDLLKYGDSIIRILEIGDDSVLIVDCIHKSMPKWVEQSDLTSYENCTEQELHAATGKTIYNYDSLDKESRRFVHEHFTLIAGVLSFVSNEKKRSSMIAEVAADKCVSKQTIRNYLWLYLAYQDISALAPKQKQEDRPLTQDEKNMRWALNKFFYTRHKNSLNTAYTLMLKEKYCDPSGMLLSEYPSIHQFKYFYRKYNKMQTYFISREGLKAYQRNHRPLLGDGVQAFAPSIGVGMLDSTICDIYLVDNAGNLIGRNGLKVNKLRYRNDAFTEHYLRGGTATVAYNPDDVSRVWLLEDGIYSVFSLAESRFTGLKLEEAEAIKGSQKQHEKSMRSANLQAQIDLAGHIEAIANTAARSGNTNIKQIRHTRKKEQSKAHIDFVKGGVKNG